MALMTLTGTKHEVSILVGLLCRLDHSLDLTIQSVVEVKPDPEPESTEPGLYARLEVKPL